MRPTVQTGGRSGYDDVRGKKIFTSEMFEKTKCLAFFASFARNHLFVVAFVGL